MGVGWGPATSPKHPWSDGKCHYANQLEQLRERRQESANMYGDGMDIDQGGFGSDEDEDDITPEMMFKCMDREQHDLYAEVTDDDNDGDAAAAEAAHSTSSGDSGDEASSANGEAAAEADIEASKAGHAATAVLAGELLQRLAGHSRLGPVLLVDVARSGPVSLPSEVAAMPLPVMSLLPLARVLPHPSSPQVPASLAMPVYQLL